MSQPTTSVAFSPTKPAAAPGYRLAIPQNDGLSPLRTYSFEYADGVTSGSLLGVVELAITAPSAGPFQIAHNLGAAPELVLLQQNSASEIWFQAARYDETYLYLDASVAGATCIAVLWLTGAAAEIPLAPSLPGAFTVPHGLTSAPALVLIQMTSGAEIWLTGSDSTNLYLDASAGGVTGYAIVWLNLPNPVPVNSISLALSPSAPGPFKVAHGLIGAPSLALIQLTSSGEIWLGSPLAYDETYVYFVASAAGVTAVARVWSNGSVSSGAPTVEIPFTSSVGLFDLAHGLGYIPTAAVISMTSLGSVVFQAALRWDGTNFKLNASAAGLSGFVEVWK